MNNHVGPGTPTPDQITVEYETVPPSYGPHHAWPQYPAAPLYSAEDRPAMETLVHNLEHGYTVVWYADDLPQAQVDQLEQISGIAREVDEQFVQDHPASDSPEPNGT